MTDRMTGGELTHFLFIFETKLAVQARSHAALGSLPIGYLTLMGWVGGLRDVKGEGER